MLHRMDWPRCSWEASASLCKPWLTLADRGCAQLLPGGGSAWPLGTLELILGALDLAPGALDCVWVRWDWHWAHWNWHCRRVYWNWL